MERDDMRRHFAAAFLIASVLMGTNAHAQTTAWGTNGYVSFNGLYRNQNLSFGDTVTFDLNHEGAHVRSTHNIEAGPVFDITAGGRIVGNLGVGYAASYLRRTEVASINADLPHPFYFNQPRGLTGDARGLRYEELAIHVHGMWLIPFSERVQAAVFGGPTFFKIKQPMVSAVEFTDEYPFDQASYTGVSTTEKRASKLGYNVGVDVSAFFTQYIGIGGLVRFSRGIVKLPSPSGGTATIEAGGLQTGAGLRVRF